MLDNGQGVIDDNDISGNALAGIEIRTGANPTVRNNRVNENKTFGVRVSAKGRGTFEGNDLSGNAQGPWDVSEASEELVTRSNNIA